MIEAGVVVDHDNNPIHWHVPHGRHGGALPDSRELWDVLWENREHVLGFAHSHPWHGTAHPSTTDMTTFAAVEAGLGRRLLWWVCTFDQVVCVAWDDARNEYVMRHVLGRPPWYDRLLELSRPA